MHEPLALDLGQIVDDLIIIDRTQGRHAEHLGLSAGEHGAAMRARKQVYLRVQRTQLVDLAAVRTHLILDDQAAHLIRLDRVADLLDLLEHRVLLFFAFIFPRFKQRDGFFAQLVDLRITL